MATIFFLNLRLQTILQTEILTYLTLIVEIFFLFQLTDKKETSTMFNLNNISKLKIHIFRNSFYTNSCRDFTGNINDNH
jgi:C4-dicarboxylate transporter